MCRRYSGEAWIVPNGSTAAPRRLRGGSCRLGVDGAPCERDVDERRPVGDRAEAEPRLGHPAVSTRSAQAAMPSAKSPWRCASSSNA